MENAVDALKIAFGVLVFVIALTVAFALLSQAKATSDIMLFASDKTNYYTYSDEPNQQGRIVGADVVISSLYRYYKESVVVRVYDSTAKKIGDINTETEEEQSEKKKKKKVNDWIETNSDILDGTFLETFDEVKKGGKYIVEDDGSELTVQSGQTSIYITYTKQE